MSSLNWSSEILAIVKKKDLDCGDFANCWEDEYDWTEFDKFVIENFESDCIGFMEVELEKQGSKITNEEIVKDLKKYYKELNEVKK